MAEKAPGQKKAHRNLFEESLGWLTEQMNAAAPFGKPVEKPASPARTQMSPYEMKGLD